MSAIYLMLPTMEDFFKECKRRKLREARSVVVEKKTEFQWSYKHVLSAWDKSEQVILRHEQLAGWAVPSLKQGDVLTLKEEDWKPIREKLSDLRKQAERLAKESEIELLEGIYEVPEVADKRNKPPH